MGELITLVKRSVQSFGSDKCSDLAAAIAYNTIFTIFPVALLCVGVLGFFMGGAAARQQVVDGITKAIPLGDSGKQALAKALAGTSTGKGWFGVIGLLTAAWSASGIFGTLQDAFDSVWDVDLQLPFLRSAARNLELMVGFGGLLVLSIASTGFLAAARAVGAGLLGPLLTVAAPLFAALTVLVPLFFAFLAFLFLYWRAPHARLSWKDVWLAALIAAIFFQFGTILLSYYIVHLGGFNALAGTLGAAILVLVFVYYESQVILLAAELAKHRMLVRAGAVPATDPKVPSPKVPLTEKVKNMIVGLWVIEEPHHEQDLPYKPGRVEPVTHEPTNTKEEVLVNEQQAREEAEREAGERPARDGGSQAESPIVIYRPLASAKDADGEAVTAGDLFPPAAHEQPVLRH
ncbi:MAG TPA: YihY/virulence factor BrkB family protein [Dehalococcoidia bacterium]|jgi:membrane protein|nr:YihY/virulence factor BrkB family protein [Dehalococcoidia bacterium]